MVLISRRITAAATFAFAMVIASNPVRAAEHGNAAGIDAGLFFVYPSVGLQVQNDDNIFFEPDQETSSRITVLSPAVEFVKEYAGRKFRAGYRADIGRFSKSSDDDYEDQQLFAEVDMGVSRRGRLNVQAEYTDTHDRRGTERTQGAPRASTVPDEWRAARLGATLTVGVPAARGRIKFDAGVIDKSYDNNRQFTRFRDRENTDYGVTFFYDYGQNTDLLIEAQHTSIDYDIATLDSEENRFLAGVSWDITGKTTGTVKAGRQEKQFDAAVREDFSGYTWEVGVKWSPRTYSTFSLSSSRRTRETNGIGDFILVENVALAWQHDWRSYLNTRVSLTVGNDEYNDAARRQDDRTTFGAAVAYQLRRWLKVRFEYLYDERDSNVPRFDYQRNVVALSVEATL